MKSLEIKIKIGIDLEIAIDCRIGYGHKTGHLLVNVIVHVHAYGINRVTG